MKPKRYSVTLEALEPISHGDTLSGVDNPTNTRLFMRSAVYVGGKLFRAPDLSENAFRTAAIRVPLALHLLGALEIERGQLPQAVVNLLFSGGAMGAGAKAPTGEFELGFKIRSLYPSLELLGGAVDAFILPRGRLKVAIWPVAREWAWVLDELAPHLSDRAREVSIFDLLGEEVRTRGTGDEAHGNQMLYQYEVLAAGSLFFVELTLDPATSPAAEGALSVALGHWDGYFGGQGRQGRGRMRIVDPNLPSPEPYLEHVEAHREAMRQGLLGGTLGTGTVVCGG